MGPWYCTASKWINNYYQLACRSQLCLRCKCFVPVGVSLTMERLLVCSTAPDVAHLWNDGRTKTTASRCALRPHKRLHHDSPGRQPLVALRNTTGVTLGLLDYLLSLRRGSAPFLFCRAHERHMLSLLLVTLSQHRQWPGASDLRSDCAAWRPPVTNG
jgi:hypothetical protein